MALRDKTRTRKTYSFFRTQPIIIEGEDIIVTVGVSSVFGRTGDVVAVTDDYAASQVANDSTVSGSQVSDALDTLNRAVLRDTQFWADSSNDDGTSNGDPDTLTIDDAFVSGPDRINQYIGTCTTDLPPYGVGDHNKTVTYKEAAGVSASVLTVTAQGTTTINFGRQLALTSVNLFGAGAKHTFRYDETIDKFVLVEGASSLSGAEIRSTAGYANNAFDSVTIDLPNPTNDNVTISNIGRARYVFITASGGDPFATMTGLDASAQDEPDFEPVKTLINISGQPVTINPEDTASSSSERFTGVGVDPIVMPNFSILKIQYFSDSQRWFVLPFDRGDDVSLMRTVQTADVRAYDNELVRVNASGGPVAVTVPSPTPYPGETFAVTRMNADGVITIDGSGNPIQDPTTRLFASTAIQLNSKTGAGPVVRWYFDEVGSWRVTTLPLGIPTDLKVDTSAETTDATATTIFTYPTQADGRAIVLSLHIFSRDVATDDGLNYFVEALFNRAIGGVVTSKDENFTSVYKDQAAWDVTFVVSGSDILVKVTGEAGKTIEWRIMGGVNEHG